MDFIVYFNMRIIKFILVSVVNFSIGFILYHSISAILTTESSAFVIAYLIGICFNYFTYGMLFNYKLGFIDFNRFVIKYVLLFLISFILFEIGLLLRINDSFSYLVSNASALIIFYIFERRRLNYE